MKFFWRLLGLAHQVQKKYASGDVKVAFAESCTGGFAAECITAIPGSSAFFLGSVVVYSNQMKTALLGVPPETLDAWGAVSSQTASAMVQGLSRITGAHVALSVTGIAGPGGGSPQKPVGLVWFSWSRGGEVRTWSRRFSGTRKRIRKLAVKEILGVLLNGPPVDSP